MDNDVMGTNIPEELKWPGIGGVHAAQAAGVLWCRSI